MSIENYSDEEYKEYIETLSFSKVSTMLGYIDKDEYPSRYQILKDRYEKLEGTPEAKKSGVVGFIHRFAASFIDGLVLLPIVGTNFAIFHMQKFSAIVLYVTAALVVSLYPVICISIWGCTLGKFVMKIKVKKENGDNCSWREGFIRNIVVLIGQVIVFSLFTSILLNAPNSFFTSNDYNQKIIAYGSATVPISKLHSFIMFFWLLLDFIIFLRNDNRKALHDFMAGTIVTFNDN